jgi:hypothetical protein
MLRADRLGQWPGTVKSCLCGVVNVSVDKSGYVPCTDNMLVNNELKRMWKEAAVT